jgi:hypothetical protein
LAMLTNVSNATTNKRAGITVVALSTLVYRSNNGLT